MPSTTILVSIGILIVSFLGGVIIYYVISNDSTNKKKKQIEDVVSLSINFVIFIWLGKIILKLGRFFKDPLAVLAYPSTSHAIYLATFFIIINLLYRKLRHDERIAIIMQTFIPIFLSASFIYEFLQVVIEKQPYNNLYLFFVTGLTVGYILLHGKVRIHLQTYLFAIALLIGQLILTIVANVTIFGYRLLPIYFIVLMIIVITAIVLTTMGKKRKV